MALDSINSRLDKRLLRRARELERLNALLRGALPPELDGHYAIANIDDRTVVIMTDSPVWTTRVRQLGPRILQALSEDSSSQRLLHIRVFSRPAQAIDSKPIESKKKPPLPISSQSSQLLQQTAAGIDDDELSHALLKLAKRATE